MADYSFSTLSPRDFEKLVADLLRAENGWRLEIFGHGPDGGIDLRHVDQSGSKVIVQCKHYRGSSFSDLRKAARNELPNVEKQRPDRYIFATSQDLSPHQKDELREVFGQWLVSPADIISGGDLNIMLGAHTAVERDHFKLWMASTGVLSKIVHSGLWERSEALLEEIQDRVKLYVSNPSYRVAREILLSKGCVVITGAPGVGKSMLAEMLSLSHWQDGWQVVNVGYDIERAWEVWRTDSFQLFYVDDFFGQTTFQERLGRNIGSNVGRLMKQAARHPNKRLILTTRRHILRQAEQRDEALNFANLSRSECLVELRQYDVSYRAHLLYNHLYFSEQGRNVIREYVLTEQPRRAFTHRGFNPRIIEQVLNQDHTSGVALSERLIESFERPLLVWGPSFKQSLSSTARALLFRLASYSYPGVSESEMREQLCVTHDPTDYESACRTLEGSWIRVATSDQSVLTLSFFSPSCRDFILSQFEENPEYYLKLIGNVPTLPQLCLLLDYASDRLPDAEMSSFPRLSATAKANAMALSARVLELWSESLPVVKNAARYLNSILQADEKLGLNLSIWIRQATLSLGREPFDSRVQDFQSMRSIVSRLALSIGQVTPEHCPDEYDLVVAVFEQWAIGANEEDEFREAFETDIGELALPAHLERELVAQFESSAAAWLDSELHELDSIRPSEESPVERIRDELNRLIIFRNNYLGSTEGAMYIDSIEETIREIDEYEPSEEDLRYLREQASTDRESPVTAEELRSDRTFPAVEPALAIDDIFDGLL